MSAVFSDCSVSCEMMIAVEDIATAPPMMMATVGAISSSAIAPAATIGGRHQHLRAAHAEHLPAHGDQTRQGEFQSEREYQEDDAEIRQQTRRVVVDRQRKRVRAEQHADREIAQDRGQRKLAHGRDRRRRTPPAKSRSAAADLMHSRAGSLPASI